MKRTGYLVLTVAAAIGMVACFVPPDPLWAQQPPAGAAAPDAPAVDGDDAPRPEQPAKPVRRLYDVGDLVRIPPDAPFRPGPMPPAWLGREVRREWGLHAQWNDPPKPPTWEERLKALVDLIQKVVDPIEWRSNGGSLGDIKSLDQVLVVTQSPANHDAIAALLADLRRARRVGMRVAVDAHWVLVAPGQVGSILKGGAATPAVAGAEVSPAELEKLGKAGLHTAASVACLNGQRVHVMAGRQRSAVTDARALVSTATFAFEPIIDQVLAGTVLEVTPRLKPGGAIVRLRAASGEWDPPGDPIRIARAGQGTVPATQPEDHPVSGTTAAGVSVDRVNAPVQHLATTVRLPLGTPTLVGGMTLEPATRGGDPRQLYLVLRIDAIPTGAAALPHTRPATAPATTAPPATAPPVRPPAPAVGGGAAAPAEPPPDPVVHRTYEVYDLTGPRIDAPFDPGPLPPTRLGRLPIQSEAERFLVRTFVPAEADTRDEVWKLRDTREAELVQLIQTSVAPDTWRDGGGENGTIWYVESVLVVGQTEAIHAEVAAFLADLRRVRRPMAPMGVDARLVHLAPGEVRSILKGGGNAPGGAATAGAEVDPDALAKLEAAGVYTAASVACLNGQTVHVLSGRQRTAAVSADPQVGTAVAAYEHRIEQVLAGTVLQVTPTLEPDGVAFVDVRVAAGEWDPPGDPIRLAHRGNGVVAATQPADVNVGAPYDATTTVDRLNTRGQQLVTAVRVPVGRPVLVGGMTLEPTSKPGGDGRQLYVIVRVTAEPPKGP